MATDSEERLPDPETPKVKSSTIGINSSSNLTSYSFAIGVLEEISFFRVTPLEFQIVTHEWVKVPSGPVFDLLKVPKA